MLLRRVELLDRRPVGQRDAALVTDGEDGAHQVLAVAHPSGDAVHGDADGFSFEAHVSSTVSEQCTQS